MTDVTDVDLPIGCIYTNVPVTEAGLLVLSEAIRRRALEAANKYNLLGKICEVTITMHDFSTAEAT